MQTKINPYIIYGGLALIVILGVAIFFNTMNKTVTPPSTYQDPRYFPSADQSPAPANLFIGHE